MKFFTAILSALTLALAVLITSATPIDPRRRTSFPLNIMKRQTINVVPGNTVAMLWDPSSFPSGKTGFLKLVIGDLSDPVFNTTLVQNLPMEQGIAFVVVPSVHSGNNYVVCVTEDTDSTSGVCGGQFTIVTDVQ